MFDYFRNTSSNFHQVCFEDSPTKGLHDHYQFDDLELQSRSEMRLKHDYFLTCDTYPGQYVSYCIQVGMSIDLCMTLCLALILKTCVRFVSCYLFCTCNALICEFCDSCHWFWQFLQAVVIAVCVVVTITSQRHAYIGSDGSKQFGCNSVSAVPRWPISSVAMHR